MMSLGYNLMLYFLFVDIQTSYFFFPQVKTAYVNFVNHCYVDTEVEMKEIYTSPHIWRLFDNFLVDMARVRLCQIEKSHMNHF